MGIQHFLANQFDRMRRNPWPFNGSTKHDHRKDFGWPAQINFDNFHAMYCRNSLAAAAVDKTVAKTWETTPALWESEKPTESMAEAEIANHFRDARIWQALVTTDRRGMVGAYSGAILILADGKPLHEPVDRVSGGITALRQIIPAWEGQLRADSFDQDPASPRYGLPTLYNFNEAAVGGFSGAARMVNIHPDRVIIWSEDGTIDGRSALEPGFNDLLDAEKIKGAGGEGFWKTSRGAPIIEAAAGIGPEDLMRMFASNTQSEAVDAINKQVDDFQSGFDKALLLGGLTAKPLNISLPQPEEFFNVPVQSFAASMQMPVRILIGNQTGERASTEDARDWAKACMARREAIVLPCLRDLVARLKQWGILSGADWVIGWASLLDATPDQQMDRAAKMADVNAKTLPGDDPAFTTDEVREAAGFAPLAEIGGARTVPEDEEV